jgi:hypothetical protein
MQEDRDYRDRRSHSHQPANPRLESLHLTRFTPGSFREDDDTLAPVDPIQHFFERVSVLVISVDPDWTEQIVHHAKEPWGFGEVISGGNGAGIGDLSGWEN